MFVVTSEQMREIEERAVNELDVPSILLMENAAFAVAERCMDWLGNGGTRNVVVICGRGKNGGDGFAVARLLHVRGVAVTVFFLGNENVTAGDSRINLEITKKTGVEVIAVRDEGSMPYVRYALEKCSLVVDAIFGTGLNSDVKDVYLSAINAINESARYVISVDLPSGISADSGNIMGAAVQANQTVTLGFAKQGLYLHPGAEAAGEITIASIGVPLVGPDRKTIILDDDEFASLLPARSGIGNKGTFGQVYVLAGSDEMPGAAVLTASAAYKAGCGLVKAYVNRHAANILQTQLIEATTKILPDTNGFLFIDSLPCTKELNTARVILIGPGLGNNVHVKGFVLNVLTNAETAVVIDADALNVLAGGTSILNKLKAPCVITPHPGEMSRLTGLSIQEIVSNPIQTASHFAKQHNVITLLKGARTIVANPDGSVYINVTGNSSLAKAGSGDVLTGLIGAFIAQGKDAFAAAMLAAYLHGKAGEAAAETLSEYGVCARDILQAVPRVLQQIR